MSNLHDADVLFAISDTGGGHRSAADALRAALDEVSEGTIHNVIVDVLRVTHLPLVSHAPDLYDQLSTRWLPLYNFTFRLTNGMRMIDTLSRVVYLQSRRRLARLMHTTSPRLIVVTHPLVNRLLGPARRAYRIPCRIVTVVTDLASLHASWTYKSSDLCIVPTEEAYRLMLKRGMPPGRLVQIGFPVHPKFTREQRTPIQARQALELAPDRFTVLITGGGVGSGSMRALVPELERTFPDIQLLVITGKNKVMYDQLRSQIRSPHTHIFGFVNNMETLMAASDIVVTKAGPGTLMEAMVMRKPVLITEAVGDQEQGNIDFVLNHELGAFCPTVSRMVASVRELMQPNVHAATVARLANAVPREGALQIARLLVDQLERSGMPEPLTRRRFPIPSLRRWSRVLRPFRIARLRERERERKQAARRR